MNIESATNREPFMTDEELAASALSDTESFRVLIDRFEGKLRRYAVRLGVERIGEVDDLLQNVFIKVYQNLADFDTHLSFSSWIYRITHNEAMTLFRRRRSRPEGHRSLLDDSEFAQIASDVDIMHEHESREARDMVQRALDNLDVDSRQILVLKYFEEKNYDEISDILKISPGTVASRISRAKQKLKLAMAHYE